MNILVVNPNTTASVTERFVIEARRTAPQGTTIQGVTGTFGAAIVSTQGENIIAGHSALDLLAKHGAGYDAIVIAISFDTALEAAREVMPAPVVGITGAALAEAARQSKRIGLIVFGGVSRPLYDQLLVRYGLVERIAAIETIETASAADYLDDNCRDAAIEDAAMRLAALPDVGAIVICGAAIVGAARRLQPRISVPILDGAAPAIAAALRLVERSEERRVLPRPLAGSTGLSPALTSLLAGQDPAPNDSFISSKSSQS